MAVTYDEVHLVAENLMRNPSAATAEDVRTMAYMICDFMREPWVDRQRKTEAFWAARDAAVAAEKNNIVPIR